MTESPTLNRLAHQYFGGICRVTLKGYKPKGFTIHHIEEIENDVLRRQYPSTPLGRENYYKALEPLIQDTPERFALITNPIHQKLDHTRHGISRMKKENLTRLYELAMITVHRRKRNA